MAKKVLKKAQDGDTLMKYQREEDIARRKKKAIDDASEFMKNSIKSIPANNLAKTSLSKKSLSEYEKMYAPKKKMGGMIKRADGSYSKRGLWDNIRANKGSGKKPTAAMLKQEKKIKAKKAQGGITLAKDPNTDPKNALKDVPSEGKMLSNVNTKERGSAFSTAAKSVKNFLKEDFLGAKDSGRTAVGKTLRKIGNTAIKTAYAPHQIVGSLVGAAMSPLMGKAKITGKDKAEGNLYYSNPKERAAQKSSSDSTRTASSSTVAKKKMGGKVAKKMAPKMMMKKTKKK